MRKALRFSSKSSLSPKQLFFLSKAQISNSTFIFGNMYSLHFAHYLRLDSCCKKGALSLDEEFSLLEGKLKETCGKLKVEQHDQDNHEDMNDMNDSLNDHDDQESCSSSSKNSSPTSELSMSDASSSISDSCLSACQNQNQNSLSSSLSNSSNLNQFGLPNLKPHQSSIAVCLAPGLPFLLQNFQKYSCLELNNKVLTHLQKLDSISRHYNKMMIIIGYLPVYKGNFLKQEEAAKINDILMTLDNYYSGHEMFKNKFVQYFQVSKVLKSPDMRKCGIYPTCNSYMMIGEKLQEFIFSLGG